MKIFGTILMLGVALSSLGQSSNKYFGDAQVGAGNIVHNKNINQLLNNFPGMWEKIK